MLHNRLAQLREERANGDGGFTLIELLVVVVIIGILIAIAIPLYLNYQKGAKDKSAQSDLRNAVSTLEQCNSNVGNYPTALGTLASGAYPTTGCGQGLNVTSGTTFNYVISPSGSTAPTSYMIADTNSGGSGKFYCYNSANGGSVQSATAATAGSLASVSC